MAHRNRVFVCVSMCVYVCVRTKYVCVYVGVCMNVCVARARSGCHRMSNEVLCACLCLVPLLALLDIPEARWFRPVPLCTVPSSGVAPGGVARVR